MFKDERKEGLVYLFNGISTPYGLYNNESRFIFKYLHFQRSKAIYFNTFLSIISICLDLDLFLMAHQRLWVI